MPRPPVKAVNLADKTIKEAMKKKFCTMCGLEKDLVYFHKDPKNEDGRKNVCADCRHQIRKAEKEKKHEGELRRIEEEGLASLSKSESGGAFDPHLNEVFEAMLRNFGGVNGWARHLFATYIACDPGSQKRIKIHDMMMQLANRVTKLGLAERQLDMMEEKDLLNVMRQHLEGFQKKNDLSITQVPTIDGKIIDISVEEVEANDE